MGQDSAIPWTDHTFNPWWGCAKVSPGCENCYAEGLAGRFNPGHWGPRAPRRFFGGKHWAEPLKWNRKAGRDGVRRRVFCGSMCDVFELRHSADPGQHRQQHAWMKLGKLIDETPHLDWLLLTKRPENIGRFLTGKRLPPNVWLGVTAEDQQRADERIALLLQAPAAVHFVSVEPMLGPVVLQLTRPYPPPGNPPLGSLPIDWVICGCESGANRRPMPLDWARALRDQCQEAGVPFFLKQACGELGEGPLVKMPELDGKVWDEVPTHA